MKKIFIFLFLVIILLMVNQRIVIACTCISPITPQEALESSTAVFVGKVVSTEVQDGIIITTADPVTVTFEVSKSWKGSNLKTLVLTTPRDGTSCGYNFEEGETYIVYAQGTEDQLNTHICTRTNLFVNAQQDLQVLGEGTAAIDNNVQEADTKDTVTEVSSNNVLLLVFILLFIITLVIVKKCKKKDYT